MVVVSAAHSIRRCLMDLNYLLMEVVAEEAARLLRFRVLLRSHIRRHQSNRSRRSSMTV